MKKIIFLIAMMSICLMGYAEEQKDTESDPAFCLSWYNLGLSNMDNPERYFKNAIKANPGFSPSYYWLGSYFCKVKKRKESIDYFGRYLQVADKEDPQEKDRIEMAKCFIKEMKAGNDDYNSIIEKTFSQ